MFLETGPHEVWAQVAERVAEERARSCARTRPPSSIPPGPRKTICAPTAKVDSTARPSRQDLVNAGSVSTAHTAAGDAGTSTLLLVVRTPTSLEHTMTDERAPRQGFHTDATPHLVATGPLAR